MYIKCGTILKKCTTEPIITILDETLQRQFVVDQFGTGFADNVIQLICIIFIFDSEVLNQNVKTL